MTLLLLTISSRIETMQERLSERGWFSNTSDYFHPSPSYVRTWRCHWRANLKYEPLCRLFQWGDHTAISPTPATEYPSVGLSSIFLSFALYCNSLPRIVTLSSTRHSLFMALNRSEHDTFCDQMGLLFPDGINDTYKIRKGSYLADRRREFRSHTHQYWFVATLTTMFFLLQVIIGAIQTALGATHSPHVLVTVFGALATVIGGILAYLKSRGQPNRARQLRNSLRKVVEEIELQEMQLRNPEIKTTAREAVDYVNQLYEDARFQAETNYPEFWSTAGTKATKSSASGTTTNPSVQPTAPSSNAGVQGILTQSEETQPPALSDPSSAHPAST